MKSVVTFCYAWLQVSLICVNTWQIANSKLNGAVFVGFMISLVWCFNTQRVAFSDLKHKIIYSLGAAAGTATGLKISSILY
jgi:hypothetical protein